MALGDLERDVMAQLWDAGEPLTVRAVHERLSRRRELAYTTVMTVLDRLAKKGVLVQARDGRAYRYAPAQSREEMTAALMMDALSAAPDDAARDAALAHFVGRLRPEDLTAAIRAAGQGARSGPQSGAQSGPQSGTQAGAQTGRAASTGTGEPGR
ncbi:BlaI/MecI/CopY family transcriptional regulator [Mangrovihabitans endophyticus]|uniref:Transcriptional regulator n=1 Tax=Mangrovihabitans endophyticus TaxID=1751298 RepID=A0A8J3C7H8_9ACTN|nr:BlaI/MecI/CopY family transcriptional regulator [Mangrovihabitans endophyticus]GGL17081.1 hypothetical protein GCM10012284_59590 [Mangrovihabitans endophyticus]